MIEINLVHLIAVLCIAALLVVTGFLANFNSKLQEEVIFTALENINLTYENDYLESLILQQHKPSEIARLVENKTGCNATIIILSAPKLWGAVINCGTYNDTVFVYDDPLMLFRELYGQSK